MLHELELHPVRQDGAAPPGSALSGHGKSSIGGFTNGSAAARRLVGRPETNLSQSLEKLGGVKLLLVLALPFCMALVLLISDLAQDLIFLLLFPFG